MVGIMGVVSVVVICLYMYVMYILIKQTYLTLICLHSWVTVKANLPDGHRATDRDSNGDSSMCLTVYMKERLRSWDSPHNYLCFAYIPSCETKCNGWKLTVGIC